MVRVPARCARMYVWLVPLGEWEGAGGGDVVAVQDFLSKPTV